MVLGGGVLAVKLFSRAFFPHDISLQRFHSSFKHFGRQTVVFHHCVFDLAWNKLLQKLSDDKKKTQKNRAACFSLCAL